MRLGGVNRRARDRRQRCAAFSRADEHLDVGRYGRLGLQPPVHNVKVDAEIREVENVDAIGDDIARVGTSPVTLPPTPSATAPLGP